MVEIMDEQQTPEGKLSVAFMQEWIKLSADEKRAKALSEDLAIELGITEFTCDGCGCRETCEYAYDLYNTNGDCLGMK